MQQERQPPDEAAEVVTGGGEDGIDGIALAVPEIVAANAMFGFEMADDRLDGGAPAQLTLDLWGYSPLLARNESPELILRRRIVAAIAFVENEALDDVADKRLHVWDNGFKRMAVIGCKSQDFI